MPTNSENQIAKAITNTLISPNECDSNGESANVVDGLYKLSRAVHTGLKYLGTGDSATEMGAIEFLAVSIKEAGENIGDGLREIASAIRERSE